MNALNTQWTNAMEGGRLIDTGTPFYHFDADAVWPDHDGSTTLHIVTDPMYVHHWDGKTYPTIYAVGLLRSVETFGYGTFAADIMLPKGRNLLASFWLCGDGRWPDTGEIDVCEAETNARGSYFRLPLGWKTTNNVHYLSGEHRQAGMRNVPILRQPHNPSERFVRYECEWRPNKVTFKVDGKVVRTVTEGVTTFAGARMNAIFGIKPAIEDFTIETPMIVKSFQHVDL